MTNMAKPLRIVICGGGRTGHLNAILFKQLADVEVRLLTHNRDIVARYQAGNDLTALLPDGGTLSARLDGVSCHAGDVLHDADIVVMTQPAHVRLAALQEMVDFLPTDKKVFLGAIPGFCGFDWLAENVLEGRDNIVIWGMKDVPHTAFDLTPGQSVRMGGAKSVLHIALHDRENTGDGVILQQYLQRLYQCPVELLQSFLEITLTPGNPIMHSSVIYGLIGPYGQWHERAFDEPLCWWSDCPEIGAYFLERCDAESQALCRKIARDLEVDLSSVRPLKHEIADAYGSQIRDARTMWSVLTTNRAYDGIQAPLVADESGTGWVMDRQSRAFHEDVAFGLALLVEMGRRMAVPLPHIQEIFSWCVNHMGGLNRSSLDYFPQHWPTERPTL